MITLLGRVISKKNHKQIIVNNGRKFLISSKPYMKFERACLAQLKTVSEVYKGKVDIDFIFEIQGKFKIDLDNAISSIMDILQKAGVIDDDQNVVSLTAIKEGGHRQWKTMITITKL